MRKTWKCPKCQSERIGYFESVDDSTEAGINSRPTSRGLGYNLESKGLIDYEIHGAFVEAFVCADCGFFEEYVKNPAEINWSKLTHFRWCRPESK